MLGWSYRKTWFGVVEVSETTALVPLEATPITSPVTELFVVTAPALETTETPLQTG